MASTWRLEKEFRFEAAHRLPKHDGKCARLHGHSWRGTLICKGKHLHSTGPKSGMLVDYGDLSRTIAPLLEEMLDHHYLNETTGLENPTSENIAHLIYVLLKPKLPSLIAVTIEETCTARCTYSA